MTAEARKVSTSGRSTWVPGYTLRNNRSSLAWLMEVTTAMLSDFAQVREGLLFVSSGGITRCYREQLPAPLGVHLATQQALATTPGVVPAASARR